VEGKMLNVVVLNPGDEAGFPTIPSEVHLVERKNLGKFMLDHIGAVTVVLDTSVAVPHPYDPNATLSLDKANRMVQHAFFSIRRYREGLSAVTGRHNVADSVAEYEARVKRDRSKKEAA
jgi:hypothetical protein